LAPRALACDCWWASSQLGTLSQRVAPETPPKGLRHAQATVDVISSSGWLNPALTAMEMSQMAAQAVWDRDSHLLQLPHVTKELAAKAAAAGVETVFDLQEMEVRALPRPG